MKDLTEKQFLAKATRAGFVYDRFGYWRLPPPNQSTLIYRYNGGRGNRREQLQKMLAEHAKQSAK